MIARLSIDLDAVRANAALLARLVAPARIAAVVKANAYGHGLVPVARALAGGVDAFCVYAAEEALALREAGVAAPLLVLGPVEPRDLAALHASGAALTLWDDGAFRRDVARAARAGGAPFGAHAKIDTGVTRLGLEPRDAPRVIASYLDDPDIDVRGAYTHLAAVEELESGFTLAQLERFDGALRPLARDLSERGVLRHAAASAAAMLFPALRYDLTRIGIALYGIWPSPETRGAVEPDVRLVPALSWTTSLVTVREVEAGRSVGYGCTFRTERPSRIGVLPIGYAEGIPRAVSNRGSVSVLGRRVPIVGRVCMNMAFVDVTDVPAARPGTTVTLIGRDGDVSIEANEWGEWAGTIGYEIVARLPAGIPRSYVAEEPSEATVAIASARSSVPS